MSQKSLTHQVGILTAGRIIAYVAMFFVPLVNTRMLSVEDYGYYRQFWLLVETLVPMLVLAFPRSLLYFIPRAESRQEASALVSQTVVALSAMAFLGILVYVVMGAALGEGMGSMVRLFMWPLCLFTFVKVTTEFMEVLFIAERKVVAQSAYHAVIWGVQALVVMAVSFYTRDVSIIIWGVTLLALLRFAFVMGYIQTVFRFTLRHISLSSMREQFSFALPVGLAAITITLLIQTDKFIITRFLGREAFAVYMVGAFQVPLLNIIQASISNVTFPTMVNYEKVGDHAGVLGLWQRSLLKTLVLILPVFVFLEITARPFVTILFTNEYAAATPVFMIYLLLFLRSGFESTVLQVYKRTRFILVTSAIGLAVNLALGILLFQSIGRLGPPLAAVATMSLLTLVHHWYSARLMQTSIFHVLPLAAIAARFAAALAPGVVLWFAYRYVAVTQFHELLLACAGYTVLYAGVCAATRIVTIDDVRSLLGRSPTRGA
ncbi:MAG: oligosaccharide flippase family protein [Candidatus Krumholzibacteria bacterium]|nr:oligosaccharide flippase family protein [Candidatus Krumholzibacteria bacterium]MDH4337597.1 oligosaccharide flippase family protein [Candidatus Krumholzibacteria bacterium]MDH5270399.1 oligosaccharide flippase family protein [Candidatus Krumholzibacteria bacterium]